MSKPRLLVVSPVPPPYSGPEVMTRHLLSSGLDSTFDVIHYDIGKRRAVERKAEFDAVNIIYGLLQPFRLAYLLARHRPDIVYTNLAQNTAGFLRYASFILTARLFGARVVARVMGDGFDHFYSRFRWRWLVDRVIASVDRFIVRGRILMRQFDNVGCSERIRIVYSGIPVEDFARDDLRREKDGKVRVLFVGYLSRAKGAFDLLQAAARIASLHPEAVFQLMGARIGAERNITYVPGTFSNQDEQLEQILADAARADNVEFLGELSGDEKIAAFINADLFVLPSYSEAFPTVVLEAMAAALPVIATPVGALPEAMADSDIVFVAPGDVDALVAAINALAEDPQRRAQLGAANLRTARQHFDLAAYRQQVVAVLSELADTPT